MSSPFKIIYLLTLFPCLTFGQAGALDNTFDADGKFTFNINGSDWATGLGIQSDGKIVLAGTTVGDFSVVRLNPNGTLDNTFDFAGIFTTTIGPGADKVYALAIQADGKIVVVGSANNGANNDFAVARFNTNGSLDNSFDLDGRLTFAFGSAADVATSVLVQPDGKIVVGGFYFDGFNNSFAIARLNTDGTFDTGFDSDGKVTNGAAGNQQVNSLAIQSDNKIIAAGFVEIAPIRFVVKRYNINGTPDNTWDADGSVDFYFGGTNDSWCKSVLVQPDQKVVVGGYTNNFSNYDFALARLNTNGALDAGFGTGGQVITPIGAADDYCNSIVLQSNGKIIAGGNALMGTYTDFALARYLPNGSLDVTFDSDGKLTTDLNNSDGIEAIALQQDNKIIGAGFTSPGGVADWAVARYLNQPVNDDCPGATPLTINSTCVPVTGNSSGATQSIAAITCSPGGTGNADDDVWYTFTATETSHVIKVVGSAGFNPVIDVRSGACPGTNIACSDASTGNVESLNATGLTIGSTYYIRVYHFGIGSPGTFDICVTSSVCKTASVACSKTTMTIDPLSGSSTGSQPSCFTGQVKNDTWVKFFVGTSGTLEFTGTPINIFDQFDWAVYDISSSCPGTMVACNYNSGSGTFGMKPGGTGEFNVPINVIAGKTYVIVIDKYAPATNSGFSLSWAGTFLIGTPVASAGPDQNICIGSSTTIGGSPTASGGAPPYTFSWSPGTGLSSATFSNPNANPGSTTTYNLTLTDANGCISADNMILTVNPNSVGGTVGSSTTVCSGSNSGVLTLTGNTGSVVNWESSTNGGTTWTNISNTTNTYNFSNITSNTWFRAVVKSGACSAVNSGYAVISVIANGGTGTWTWTGSVNTNWFDCSNWNTGTLPDALSDVIIPGGTPFNPIISGAPANVRTITINTSGGGILTVNSGSGGVLNIAQ